MAEPILIGTFRARFGNKDAAVTSARLDRRLAYLRILESCNDETLANQEFSDFGRGFGPQPTQLPPFLRAA
jgi:hypothetical protein